MSGAIELWDVSESELRLLGNLQGKEPKGQERQERAAGHLTY